MKQWLQRHAFTGLVDIIVAYSSLTILYDPYQLCQREALPSAFKFVQAQLHLAYEGATGMDESVCVSKRIPVCYEQPFALDIQEVRGYHQLSLEKVIELHTSRTYHVYMIGFLPGFPYMASVDEKLRMPRKVTPRIHVAAGSVGIAGEQTGIYSIASPGGWQIIGRTPLTLFNPVDNPPVTLEAGDKVQFYAISKKEFDHFEHVA